MGIEQQVRSLLDQLPDLNDSSQIDRPINSRGDDGEIYHIVEFRPYGPKSTVTVRGEIVDNYLEGEECKKICIIRIISAFDGSETYNSPMYKPGDYTGISSDDVPIADQGFWKRRVLSPNLTR